VTGAPSREPTCQELAELITDYLEGLLAPAQHALFDLHLSECPDCTLYVEQMRTTIVVAGRVTAEDIPLVVRDELLAAFRSWAGGLS
jgi:predicted anti-sigma-YlaC factor YlaD